MTLIRHDVPASGRIAYRHLVRAELTKIATDPVIPRVFWGVLAVNTALCALAVTDSFRISGSQGLVRLSDLGAVMFAPVYLFLVIPVYAAADEYVSGQNRITLVAVPNRRRLLAAKLLSLALVIGPSAILTLLPGRLTIAVTHGLDPAPAMADLARWSTAYILMSCIAYALAALLRSRVAPLAILVLIPLLLATGVLPWPGLIKLLPDQLSLNILGAPGYDVTAMAPTSALLLLTTWAATLIAAQGAALLQRDS